jgi:hypothetical protein
VAIIAGALERKVWCRVSGRTMYANLFILLVGGAGIGKGDAMRHINEFWEPLKDIHIAPISMTRAALADSLNAAGRQVLHPQTGLFDKFNSLQINTPELGTFLTEYGNDIMSTLNHLWDCELYREMKRSMKEPIIIPKPHLNIIAGTTPAWLSGNFPETAWMEGFASRLTLVFSNEKSKLNLWNEASTNEALKVSLDKDLYQIHQLYGQFHFAEGIQEALTEWFVERDGAPMPEHPKMESYLPRRHVHFIKLCMIFSASRANDLVVRMEDFQSAQDLFLETESRTPDIFKAMKYSSDSGVMDEVHNYVWTVFAKTQQGVPEHLIMKYIAERTPSYSVDKIFAVMVSCQMLVMSKIAGEGGRPHWKPAPKVKF